MVSLAERIGAPVWISPLSGRSGFPEDHALFRGFLPPVREQLWRRLEGHDVILALGTPIFTYHVHSEGRFIPDGSRLFHLDCDPAQAAWAPVGTSVLTTIDAGVSGLLDLVEKADRPLPEPRVALAKPQAADPIDPAFVVETLKERLPEDAVIVEEVPSYREMLHARLPITRSGGS